MKGGIRFVIDVNSHQRQEKCGSLPSTQLRTLLIQNNATLVRRTWWQSVFSNQNDEKMHSNTEARQHATRSNHHVSTRKETIWDAAESPLSQVYQSHMNTITHSSDTNVGKHTTVKSTYPSRDVHISKPASSSRRTHFFVLYSNTTLYIL